MDSTLLLVIILVIGALVFDFINGFHDTANSIATTVSTKALKPRQAIVLAAIMNFIGAMTFTGVAKTITTNLVNPFTLENGSIIVLSALIAAISWNIFTWYRGIPSSSSHAIIGSITGAAVAAAGFRILDYNGFITILEALLLSPIIAFIAGFLIYTVCKLLLRNCNLAKTNKRFRLLQIGTAAMQSYAHGTNDAQKSMGIITLVLIANGFHETEDIPLWVRISCALAMGLGTSIGGWRIIKTMATRIMKIRPINGVAADLSSASITFIATYFHLPISTTYVAASSILGVGAAHRIKGVQWGTARTMLLTWFITLPSCATLAGLIYFILNFLAAFIR